MMNQNLSHPLVPSSPEACEPPKPAVRRVIHGPTLADRLRADLNSHCSLPPLADVAVVLWALHTYINDHRSGFSPLLAVTSLRPSAGKSTLMRWLQTVVCRAEYSSCPRAKTWFEKFNKRFDRSRDHFSFFVDDPNLEGDRDCADFEIEVPGDPLPPDHITLSPSQSTLLFDNLEHISVDLRDIMVSGHSEIESLLDWPNPKSKPKAKTQRGPVAMIGLEYEDFPEKPICTWSPKAIARIGAFPDKIAARSIPIRMEPKPLSLKLERVTLEAEFNRFLIRPMIEWAQENREAITTGDPEMPPGFGNRTADNWRPLLAMADVLGGSWPRLARESMIALEAAAEDAAAPDFRPLTWIRGYFQETGHKSIFTSELLDLLDSKKDPRDPKWTSRRLAEYLGKLDIPTNTTVRLGHEVAKGYKLESFHNAFNRLDHNNLAPTSPKSNPHSVHSSGSTCNPVTDVTESLSSREAHTPTSHQPLATNHSLTTPPTDLTHLTEAEKLALAQRGRNGFISAIVIPPPPFVPKNSASNPHGPGAS